MALDFLGGIAGAYQAIQKGVDDSKERDYLGKRRQWQEEDRAAQAEDREYTRGQRQRTVDEQRRADRLRDADAAIPFEVDAAPAPGGISLKPGGITKPATPSSKPASAAPMVEGGPTEPVAPMPTAEVQPVEPAATTPMVGEQQAPQTKALPKRQITYGEYLRQLAKNRREAGQVAPAMELSQKADQWTLEQAGRRLNGLIGSSSSMSLEQYAREAAKLFNEDPLPQSIRGIRPNADGSVTATISMNDGGYTTEQTFRSKEDLTRAMQSVYQPENFAKLQQAVAEARAKSREELMKPRTVKPGETIQVFNPETGKYQVIAEGRIPAGYEVVEGANGETMLRRFDTSRGTGTGASSSTGKGAKVDDPMKGADDAWEFVSTKGEVKLQPEELATGRRMTRSIASTGVDPATAAEVAITVMRDPKKGRLEINSQTGTIDMIFRDQKINGGRAIAISQSAGTLKDLESSVEGGAATVRGEVTKMISGIYGDKAPRMIEIASNPELSKQYIESAQAKGLDVAAVSNRLNLIRSYLVPEPKGNPAQAKGRVAGAVGGILPPQRQQSGGQPSYEALMAAKSDREKLLEVVGKMSPDRREAYLSSRLPEIEKRIKFNENYRTY